MENSLQWLADIYLLEQKEGDSHRRCTHRNKQNGERQRIYNYSPSRKYEKNRRKNIRTNKILHFLKMYDAQILRYLSEWNKENCH